jgi:inner membrane transporter RhtA
MLALLPATATVIGLIVLGQVPTARDLAGIALVILGVALHRDAPDRREEPVTAPPAPVHQSLSPSGMPDAKAIRHSGFPGYARSRRG